MRTLLAVALLACAAPSQNLLVWNRWLPVNGQLLQQLRVTPEQITFYTYEPLPQTLFVAGIEQQVLIPEDGEYQLWFDLYGFDVGGDWSIQGQKLSGSSGPLLKGGQQRTWTVTLQAGTATVRYTDFTSNIPNVYYHQLTQPSLQRVKRPVVNLLLLDASYVPAWWSFQTPSSALVLFSMQPASTPIRVPGINGFLELDPMAGLTVLGQGSMSGIPPGGRWQYPFWIYPTWPDFHLQAVDVGALNLGSRLHVRAFDFGRF